MQLEIVDVMDELLKDSTLEELKRMHEFVVNYRSSNKTTFVSDIVLKLINAHIDYKEFQIDEAAGLIPEEIEDVVH